MSTARPYWKGYLKLALVSCPIALYPATTSTERVAFRQINKKTGNRLRQQVVDEVTREPVNVQDKGRGYEYAKNQFLLIEEAELEAIEIESNHTIDVDAFVLRSELDERYFDSVYYIAPDNPVGVEAYFVIREAMRRKGMVALGRVVLSKRERVVMLRPWGNGLMATTLRYPHELRDSQHLFHSIPEMKVDDELLVLAEHVLKAKQKHFDPATFVDHYEEAVMEMLKKKEQGLPAPEARPFVPPPNVVNLFEAFRQSLAEEGKPLKARAKKPKKGNRRVEGQSEMLLPIVGKRRLERKAAPEKKSAQRRHRSG